MRFRLIPRDESFFPIFNEVALNAQTAANLLAEMFVDLSSSDAIAEKIVEVERKGDTLTQQMFRQLDTSIVTPFDREDIHAMVDKLDDVVDEIRSVAELVRMHHVSEPISGVTAMVALLVKASDANVRLFEKLKKLRDIRVEMDEIDALESEGDALHRQTTADLFSGEHDALTVLKWMDIVEDLEKALNCFERTSDIIATIALKHA